MMRPSTVVILLAGSDHLKNVKTLQSIFKQDYENIRLVVCNDHTYGFENQRLLNNFHHQRPENIRQIYFRENPRPLGAYGAQAQFWPVLNAEFVITLEAGTVFSAPDALSQAVDQLSAYPTAAALATRSEQVEEGSGAVRQVLCLVPTAQPVLTAADDGFQWDRLADHMVLFRLAALRDPLPAPETATAVAAHVLQHLMAHGHALALSPLCLTRCTPRHAGDTAPPVPTEFGGGPLERVTRMLEEGTAPQPKPLFGAPTPTAPAPKIPRRHLLLYKLSTLKIIGACAVLSLLLFIAAGLFLHLQPLWAGMLGMAFLACALVGSAGTAGLVLCNIYYKKNPQRLVNTR